MKKASFRLTALLLGLGFISLSLELFLRINPKFGYNYNSFRFKCEKLGMDYQTFNYLRPSALLGYEHIPNCNSKINSYGLIGREYKFHKDKGTFRILILGDSIAEQGYSGDFLEAELNGNPKLRSEYEFEVWNAGVAGYDVRRYALYLGHKGLNYKPDMVIIFLFMNDFRTNISIYYKTDNNINEYYFPINEISKRYNVSPFFMKHSYLYRFVILRLDSYLLSKEKIQFASLAEGEGGYYLQIIKEICEKNKIPLFLMVFPYLKPLDEYKDYQINEYKTICKVLKGLEINYIDLYSYLPAKNLCNLRDNKEDEIHLNREGHRIIAEIIYGYLLDNFFKVKKA